MLSEPAYHHTQRAPLCMGVYAMAVVFFVISATAPPGSPVTWLFPIVALLMVVLGTSFHHLRVTDEGDRLSVAFGPLPLFRRSVRYQDVQGAEVGRTTLLDGWGIHLSPRGGWVWNLWGFDCVVVRFHNGRILRIGSDDAQNLAEFLTRRTSPAPV